MADGTLDVSQDFIMAMVRDWFDYYWSIFYDYGEGNMMADYMSIIAIMRDILDVSIGEVIQYQLDISDNIMHIDGWHLQGLMGMMGLAYDENANEIYSLSDGFYERMKAAARKIEDFEGEVSTEMFESLKGRVRALEDVMGTLDQATIDDIKYIADHATEIKDIIDGSVESITSQVMEEVKPYVDGQVDIVIDGFSSRIEELEWKVGTVMNPIYDFFTWFIAGLLYPEETFQGSFEDAMGSVSEWIAGEVETQLIPIEKRLKDVEQVIQDGVEVDKETIKPIVTEIIDEMELETGLSEQEVRDIVNEIIGDETGKSDVTKDWVNAQIADAIAGVTVPPGITSSQVQQMINDALNGLSVEVDVTAIDQELLLRAQISESATYSGLAEITGEYIEFIKKRVDDLSYVTEEQETTLMDKNNAFIEYILGEVKPLTDALSSEMVETLTGLADVFDTPESLIAWLLDVPEGEEDAFFNMMQILVAQTLELRVS